MDVWFSIGLLHEIYLGLSLTKAGATKGFGPVLHKGKKAIVFPMFLLLWLFITQVFEPYFDLLNDVKKLWNLARNSQCSMAPLRGKELVALVLCTTSTKVVFTVHRSSATFDMLLHGRKCRQKMRNLCEFVFRYVKKKKPRGLSPLNHIYVRAVPYVVKHNQNAKDQKFIKESEMPIEFF